MPTFRQDNKLGDSVPLIKTPDIGDKQVTERKLADGSVTSSKLSTEIANMLSLLTTRISAFKVADNLSSLPTEENTIGWLVDNHLYVYVGNGSTPESGMYQDCGELRGPQGIQGEQGLSGLNGKSAYDIWTEQPGNEDKSEIDFLEFTRGSKGDKGDQGERGYDISNIEQLVKSTEDGGKNIIRVTRSDGWSKVFEILNGSKGSKGDKGTSIVKLEQTRKTTESSGLNTIEATLGDGTKESFEIYNGAKGEQGDKGEKGDKGDQGEIGPQGNSGIADASNKTLVNDAITGGETDFLSAEVGKLGILTYDCSKGGTVTHATLQDAINSVPTTFQKVGITITYKSGDTIYRYTLKANAWSADPENWFSVEEKLDNIDSEISNFKGAQQSPIAKKSGYYIRNGNYLTNNSFEVAIYKIKKNTTYYLHIKLVGGNDVGYYCNEDGSNPHNILGTYEGNASQFAYFDGSIISDVDTYICLNSVIEGGYYCDVNSSITLKEKLDNIDSEISNFKGAQQSPIAKKSGYYIRNGNYLTNNSFEVAIYKIKKNTTYYLHIKLVGGNDVGYYCNEDGSNPHNILGTYEGNASQFAYFDGSIISDVDTYICLNSVIEGGYYCDVNSSITLKEKLDNIDSEISNFKGGDNDVRIYCIGDSLTQGQGGDNSYPPKLANLSGKTVINYGSGGDRTFEIGARIGCIPFECSPFTIPASGSVQIAISTTDSMSPKWMENFAPGRQNANSFLNPYVIEGIKGNISHAGDTTASSSNHKYYFTRISDGTKKKVDFPTMVFPETPISNKHIKVIWSGTNDGSNMFNHEGGVEHVVKEIKLLVDTAEKYIVVGCHDCNSSFSYDQLLAFNTKLKDTFGNHYVDIYDFIIKYGLAYEGLTATQQDKTDIANNIVPTSLRSDAIHFNSYGYDIVANLIYERLCALGYL